MDEELSRALGAKLCRAQDGDNLVYQQFLEEVSRELRPFVKKRVRAHEHVEDVLQDILFSVHKARHTYLPEKSLAPWLFAIANHRLVDFYRRYRLQGERETALDSNYELQASSAPLPSEGQSEVLVALDRLPGRQREIIELMKLEGLSAKEVSGQLGMSESAVKVAAFRGYQALRKFLGAKK